MELKLINTADLEKKLYDLISEPDYQHVGEDWRNGLYAALYAMEVVPAVEAVPLVKGKWIHPKDYVVSNGFLCSVCKHEEASFHAINPLPGGGCRADENGNFYHPPKINYCPNCGAKMS